MSVDREATARTRARYERIAPLYDAMDAIAERAFSDWREQLWSLVKGPRVLEVGVGTGKNMPYYPADVQVTAIDLTPGMVQRAQRRAGQLDLEVEVQLGDAQNLEFAAATFDEVVTTCVFCSVPDPLLGLEEVARVTKPGGRLLMLEHVRASEPLLGAAMDVVNPVAVRIMGANINRETVSNVSRSPWNVERVEDLGLGDIFKLIVACNGPISDRRNER